MRYVVAAAGVLIVATLLTIRRQLVVITVSGTSMMPALAPGDRVLLRRVPGDALRIGDLAVFCRPMANEPGDPQLLVKRVSAVAGSRQPADAPYSVPHLAGTVPEGWVALLGDNPQVSLDSRELGLIPTHRVIGVVIRKMNSRSRRLPRAAKAHV